MFRDGSSIIDWGGGEKLGGGEETHGGVGSKIIARNRGARKPLCMMRGELSFMGGGGGA